jgi:hypothetical protein
MYPGELIEGEVGQDGLRDPPLITRKPVTSFCRTARRPALMTGSDRPHSVRFALRVPD